MRNPETCHIEYCGYLKPQTQEELEFEVLGLKTAIHEINKRIASLEQSAYLVKMVKENDSSHSRES